MHGQLFMNGPVALFLQFLLALAASLALFVVGDASLRKRPVFEGRAWLRRVWALPSAAFLVVLIGGQFPSLGILGIASMLLMPIEIGIGVGYLLNVVYPKTAVDVPHDASRADAEAPAD